MQSRLLGGGRAVITKEFKRLVEEGLQRQGISLRQAALGADITPSYLSKVLSGKRDFPSDAAILRLADVLGVEPPELLLAEAGRVRFRASRDLTKEEMESVMRTLRDVMSGKRHSIRKQRPRSRRSAK
jgi:lambda repressor-like predicted transcriptional regulator